MTSKDVCFATSVRHLMCFPFFKSSRALVPSQWAVVGMSRLMGLFSPADTCCSCWSTCLALVCIPSFAQICLCLTPSLMGALPYFSVCFLGELGPFRALTSYWRLMNFLSSCVTKTKGCCVQLFSLQCAGALQEAALPPLYSNQNLHVCFFLFISR